MDFTGVRQLLAQSSWRHLAVNRNGNIGADSPFITETIFDAGKTFLESLYDLAHRGPTDLDYFLAICKVSIQGRNPNVVG